MKKVDEIDYTNKDEVLAEVRERRELQDKMLGWLYPSVLESEIEKILGRWNEAKKDGAKCS